MTLKSLIFLAPFNDIDSPYASTAYLAGFLRSRGYPVAQGDLSIELFTRLFSDQGLHEVARKLGSKYRGRKGSIPKTIAYFLKNVDELGPSTEQAVRFLQGGEQSLATEIASGDHFPSVPGLTDTWWAAEQIVAHAQGSGARPFGSGFEKRDQARYLATKHVYTMVSLLAQEPSLRLELMLYPTIKGYPEFNLDVLTFDPLLKHLKAPPSVVDRMLEELVSKHLEEQNPDLVGISAPLTSTAYGAFRIAKQIRKIAPKVKIALGGGFPSTELRGLSDIRVFDFFDYIVLDDGEKPILRILEHEEGKIPSDQLFRTLVREKGCVVLKSNPTEHDIPRRNCGTPYFGDLPNGKYIPTLDNLYPASLRNFQNFRMNKMNLAQGCYWKRCTFCDVSLAYIDRYDPSTADTLIDQIEKILEDTGERGFRFVDEAMPPMLVRALCERLITRKISIFWTGMMRLDKAFDSDLPEMMAKAGCMAALCGLEVATERMLMEIVDKGIGLKQVAQTTHRLAQAGLMVHTYLMFAYPMQTAQDTVDSLEFVRQLFEAGCVHSAVWSRFALTAHSPIGLDPGKFGIRVLRNSKSPPENRRFCKNVLLFKDPNEDFSAAEVEPGLLRSLRFYMHGLGFERDVREWFDGLDMPKPAISASFVKDAIAEKQNHASPTTGLRARKS